MKERVSQIIGYTCPGDSSVGSKEDEKVNEYRDLAMDIKASWQTKMVKIVPVVIECLGTIPERLEGNLKEIGSRMTLIYVSAKDSAPGKCEHSPQSPWYLR